MIYDFWQRGDNDRNFEILTSSDRTDYAWAFKGRIRDAQTALKLGGYDAWEYTTKTSLADLILYTETTLKGENGTLSGGWHFASFWNRLSVERIMTLQPRNIYAKHMQGLPPSADPKTTNWLDYIQDNKAWFKARLQASHEAYIEERLKFACYAKKGNRIYSIRHKAA